MAFEDKEKEMQVPDIDSFVTMSWEDIEPYYQHLQDNELSQDSLHAWLRDWTRLRELVSERYARLQLNSLQDTRDKEAESRYQSFLEDVYPRIEAADQALKKRLLAGGLKTEGMEVPLQKMRARADIFRDENLPLQAEERKLGLKYNKIRGHQTVVWEDEEITLVQVRSLMQTQDRGVRERLWTLSAERQLQDRQAINANWQQLMEIRGEMAENAGRGDYRAYRWQQLARLDYEPQDSLRFIDAVEEVVVPAANRVYERYRDHMGLPTIRPWDVVDNRSTLDVPVLKAFESEEDLVGAVSRIFHKVDPELGQKFAIMHREDLLDLSNRKGKAPGAFCTSFPTQKRPFIFMNAVGLATDLTTLFHESGHAFHVFERSKLPYHHMRRPGNEFGEVASTAMELLAAPYVAQKEGGFFSPQDTARFRRGHLEDELLFWPYMAVVVAFQHWVYENHKQASRPEACDQKWAQLVDRFLPAVDWSGEQDMKETGWQRKLHIHTMPFYYVEYGLALLGAVQLWGNAREDQALATRRYRQALSLGGTAPLPVLYETAGATFAFDAHTLGEAVQLMEDTLADLETVL